MGSKIKVHCQPVTSPPRMPTVKLSLLLGVLSLMPFLAARSNDFETPQYLRNSMRQHLEYAKTRPRHYGIAKNLVLAVGDGMGISTMTAARIYMGQRRGQTGEEFRMEMEKFPNVGLSKTYNLDRQVSDSAGTAVAMMAGIKVNIGTLGVDGRVSGGLDCSAMTEDTMLKSVLDYALEEGKSVGIVTTTRITHATPAAAYAHVPYREWEADSNMRGAVGCEHVKDITYQLVMNNSNINVILGGGKRSFKDRRSDGLDLTEEWKTGKSERNLNHKYVQTKGELMNVNAAETDYLLGLFSDSHMDYEANRQDSGDGQPSLIEMTTKALEILKKNPKGFFLLVEGGRIDHAHHNNYGKLSLMETDVFDQAVKTVVDHTSVEDTLITVTADHSHVFTIGGYPTRGNDIFGTAYTYERIADNLPILTLSYANGPNGRVNETRVNYTNVNTSGPNFQQAADVKKRMETHGGEDVAIFTRGPMAHLIHSSHEQSYIAHVMMYAACLGDYKDDCDRESRGDPPNTGGVHGMSPMILALSACVTLCCCIRRV